MSDEADEVDGTDEATDGSETRAEDDPFAALADDETPETDPFEDDLFTERETGTEETAVWEQLEDADADEGAGEPSVPAADGTDSGGAVVEKRSYCEQCEYLSEPPEIACTNPGTEIVEFVDTERVRVRNCPVVARRQSPEIDRIADRDGEDGGPTDGPDADE